MNTSYNPIVVSNYLGLLQRLNRESKINLVAGLVSDITHEPPKPTKKTPTFNRFFGAFQSDKSAEELIHEIRTNRSFQRKTETF